MLESKKQELLRNAANLMGHEELAGRLKVPVRVLDAWMNGQASMPDRELKALADILDKFAADK
jgi:hypothetical protein